MPTLLNHPLPLPLLLLMPLLLLCWPPLRLLQPLTAEWKLCKLIML
jgi:hypothetical protein